MRIYSITIDVSFYMHYLHFCISTRLGFGLNRQLPRSFAQLKMVKPDLFLVPFASVLSPSFDFLFALHSDWYHWQRPELDLVILFFFFSIKSICMFLESNLVVSLETRRCHVLISDHDHTHSLSLGEVVPSMSRWFWSTKSCNLSKWE